MNHVTKVTGAVLTVLLMSACVTRPHVRQRVPEPVPVRKPQPAVQRVQLKPAPPVEEATTVPLAMPQIHQPQALQQTPPQGTVYSEILPQENGYGELAGSDQEIIQEQQRPVEAAQPGNPVLVGLLAQADQDVFDGHLDRAAAAIERALRIDPKDAQLWKRLAKIRLEQKRPHQAESTARKSIRLARGDWGLLADNWLLIAEARDLRGDVAGADRARAKAARYQ